MRDNHTVIPTRESARQRIRDAAASGNSEELALGMEEYMQAMAAEREQFDVERADEQALVARGLRQLTSKEKEFYQKFSDLREARDPKQALTDANLTLPTTTIDRVFEDLRTEHELLRRINFQFTGAAVKMIVNTNGYNKATRGTLCASIITEITSGFAVVETNLVKISAFLPVCKEILEFGPVWLDRYVRDVLYEAYANGLEDAVINGNGVALDGKSRDFIGMRYQYGPNVTTVGGVYPLKPLITVTSLDIQTMGNLIGLLAVGPNGQSRAVRDLILVVNPADRYTKIDPATLYRREDGTYIRSTPYPYDVIESPAMPVGEAGLGLARRYAAFAGGSAEGNIDYSDHYQFLEDNRVYLVKGFGNGFPMDNNAFLRLDISGLQPAPTKVVVVDDRTPSSDATLSALSLGADALSPAFAAETTEYTATTTNASNTINAVPADAGAAIKVELNDVEVPNGSALAWETGENTVVVTVTAEDGTTTETYTVTVTKS